MLTATGLGVRLGNRAILHDVDFTARPGAVTAIVGPNGSGKTTLLRVLSGGEQQRVHLARVLVQVWEPVTPQGPRWLFLDEPVSSLDIGHQLMVMRIARRYADAGGGVVAVMHDLNLSAMFADQIALMQAGRLVVQGAPAAVLTDAHLGRAYGCAVRINTPPASGPWLVPQAMAG